MSCASWQARPRLPAARHPSLAPYPHPSGCSVACFVTRSNSLPICWSTLSLSCPIRPVVTPSFPARCSHRSPLRRLLLRDVCTCTVAAVCCPAPALGAGWLSSIGCCLFILPQKACRPGVLPASTGATAWSHSTLQAHPATPRPAIFIPQPAFFIPQTLRLSLRVPSLRARQPAARSHTHPWHRP